MGIFQFRNSKKNISDLVEFEQNIHLIQGKVEDTVPNNKKLPKKYHC